MNHLVIRTDATASLGAGHVMRTLAIAEEWLARGGKVTYLGQIETSALIERLLTAGCNVEGSPEQTPGNMVVPASERAFLLVDHYGLGPPYYDIVKELLGWPLWVVDDNAEHEMGGIDGLVNYNAHATGLPYETDLETMRLLGPRYCLIRREFRGRYQRRIYPYQTGRILLAWGGVVTPEVGAKMAAIGEALRGTAGLEVRTPGDFGGEMAEAMAWADLMVGAAGVSLYEACSMGLPSMAISTALNQEGSVVALHCCGAVHYLGRIEQLEPGIVVKTANMMAADGPWRKRLGEAGRELVDGEGAGRVVKVMLEA